MQLLLLSAGTGSRLSPLTDNIHKSLLIVRDGMALIDYQLSAAYEAGIRNISIVIGHAGDKVREYVLTNANRELAFSFMENPDYIEKNLDYSIYLALSKSSGNIIYFEGDTIVEPKLLQSLASSKAEVCIALDSRLVDGPVDMLVTGNSAGIDQIHLNEHGHFEETERREFMGTYIGTYICVARLGEEARCYVVQRMRHLTFTGRLHFYDILSDAMKKFDSDFVDIQGGDWVEVDDANDLQRAREIALRDNFHIQF